MLVRSDRVICPKCDSEIVGRVKTERAVCGTGFVERYYCFDCNAVYEDHTYNNDSGYDGLQELKKQDLE